MIDKLLSRRIALLRFPLIVSIVYIHMHTADIHFGGSYAHWFERTATYIAEYLARISVPLFFLLSGYLFFATLKPTAEGYLKKYKSRFRTLLVPFLFWNALIFCFYLIAQTLPATAGYFSGDRPIIPDLGFWERIRLFFGVGEFQYPVAYQFWFIRDLLFMVLLSPLLYLLLRFVPWLLLGGLFIVWVQQWYPHHIVQIDPTSVLFFTLGAYGALKACDMRFFDTHRKAIVVVYLLLSLGALLTGDNSYLQQISIFVGVFAVLVLTAYFAQSAQADRLIEMEKYSFFLFAIHEPLQSVLRKVVLKAGHIESDIAFFLLYLLVPAATVWIVLQLYKVWEKYLPGLLRTATGERV
ncbi:MAG: hypothetical protein DSZ05_04250 [Sulfurospirillum sp.]|nr:MAG: hypothetical protein DSZ05_04250 [Sulfurospirillum sp.]